jgi:PncC family amidohydrolase
MNEGSLKVIRELHERFTQTGLKLSVAESCTGGLISHYLTWLPGSSTFFEAGVVTYSASSKEHILGVSSETIAAHGVVSGETAREMAERMRLIAGTDYALSTTGNLGPDVLEGKDRGLVYIGISAAGKTMVRELHLVGTRAHVREEAALLSLYYLRDRLAGQTE